MSARPLLPLGAWVIAWVMVLVDALPWAAHQGLVPVDLNRWQLTQAFGFYEAGFRAALQGHIHVQFVISLISYLFVHLNTLHLLVNLVTFLGLAYVIDRLAGARVLLILFFVAGIGGALGFGLLSDGPAPVIGCSGALAGMIGAVMVWQRRPLVWLAVAGLMLLDMLPGRGPLGLVAWEAHLGGFVTGSLLALVLPMRIRV